MADRYAKAHSRHARLMYRVFLRDIRRFEPRGRLLEAGAGPGILAVMMAKQNPGARITALDVSADMQAAARTFIEESGLEKNVQYVVGDVNDNETLRGLGTFDFVYSTFSLHHWREPVSSLGNLLNVLNDGGILYVHDFKRVWWASLLPLGEGDRDSIRASYTPAEIRQFMSWLNIREYDVKTFFPGFIQSVILKKQPSAGRRQP